MLRDILECLSPWFARRGKLRVIPDRFNPGVDYLGRHYIRGGDKDAAGEIIHRRFEVCLHKIMVSDISALHNHPGAYGSLILAGVYDEHTPDGVFRRRPGHFRIRAKDSWHRLEIVDGPVWTLFIFLNREPGTDESDWYFRVNGKRVHQRLYLEHLKASMTR